MSVSIQAGNKGTVFRATIYDGDTAVDVSGVDWIGFVFGKPDGSVFTTTALFVGDGTDGQVSYTTDTTTTLDQSGLWKLQAIAEWPSSVFRTGVFEFKVLPNIG